MKRCGIFLFSCLLMISGSCNSPGSDKTASDSTATMSATVESAAQDSLGKRSPEINHFPSGTPISSMPIIYQRVRDTLYGYRIGDTLHVEGDMMYVYPTVGAKAVGTTQQIWPVKNGAIIIPFLINDNCGHPERIKQAMKMWQNGVKIDFKDKIIEDAYVEFRNGTRNESQVGRTGKHQLLYVTDTASPGTIAHEIGHTLGLYHEQSRHDRDSFVHVICINDPDYRHAYIKDPYAQDKGEYDYFSIMHYKPDDCLEIKKKGLPPDIPGQRKKISTGDYKGVKLIYHL